MERMELFESPGRNWSPRSLTPSSRTVSISDETVTALKAVGDDWRANQTFGDYVSTVFGSWPLASAKLWSLGTKTGAKLSHLALVSLRLTGLANAGHVNSFPKDAKRLALASAHCGHTPKEIVGPRELCYERRSLPIYGESSEDELRRMVRTMPGFGAWFFGKKGYAWYLNPKMSHELRWQLFWFVDERRDAFDQTLEEIHAHLQDWDPERLASVVQADGDLDDESARKWLRIHAGFMADVEELLSLSLGEWEQLVVGRVLTSHSCGLTPITPPAIGGVYFVRSRAPIDAAIKIGFASKSIAQRIRDIQTAHPWPLELLAFIPGAPRSTEQELHRRFEALHLDEGPGTEWFKPEGELISFILSLRGDST